MAAKKRKNKTFSDDMKNAVCNYYKEHGRKATLTKYPKVGEGNMYSWLKNGYPQRGSAKKTVPASRGTVKRAYKKRSYNLPIEAQKTKEDIIAEQLRMNAEVLDLDSYGIEIVEGIQVEAVMQRNSYDGYFPFEALGKKAWKKGQKPIGFFVPLGYRGIKDIRQVMTNQTTRFNNYYARLNKKVKFSSKSTIERRDGVDVYGITVTRVE